MAPLENSRVLVVGAGSGMGRATAQRCHEHGAEVVLAGRTGPGLAETAAGITRATTVVADLTSPADRERLAATAGPVDHVVITAADLAYGEVDGITADDMDRALGSKVTGPFFLAQRLAPSMPRTGSITVVSGVAAERPQPRGVLTGMVNGALDALVRGLAVALAPIRVNAVSPGWVDTPMWRTITDEEGRVAAFSSMRERIPVRRLGRPDDIAQAVCATMTNEFISGSTLYVDGGQRLA